MVRLLQLVTLSMGIPLKQNSPGRTFCLKFSVRASGILNLYFIQLSIELARATSDENVQLVQKVKELEVEVTVWKQALSSSRGAQDRENKPVVTFANPQKNVALCVIDGTRSFFSAKYITLGEEGGRRAAQEVIRGITNHLADDRSLQSKVFIGIYVRRGQLRHDLVASGVCTPEQFDEFFTGLNETSYLNIVEVSNKRDADKKIEGEQTGGQVKLS
jgi:hypothetical protein